MKIISLLVLLFSFAALADETCKTSLYDFRITNSYIEAKGQGENVRLPYHEVRTLSRRSRADFKALINILKDQIETDDVLTPNEAALIERFALTVADGQEELLSMMYAKAYNKKGLIVVRYMVTENGSYRCL
jgi:primosomal protein N'